MIWNTFVAVFIAAIYPGLLIAVSGCTTVAEQQTIVPQYGEFTIEPKMHSNVIDGPYVFYKKDKIYVKNIKRVNDKVVVVEEIYDENTKNPVIYCSMDPNEGKPFKVVLRKEHIPPPSIYEMPEKLLALSDIEGNFKIMTETLQGNDVIDEDYQWTFGSGHLVLVGDFFDRGDHVTPCLWLLYELERQAALAGGFVHFINGNHEEMNMRGDIRYVRNKYKMSIRKLNVSHHSLYGRSTELGRWLRSKNIIERIGTTLFTHGGLSPVIGNYNMRLNEINAIARKNFGVEKWRLVERGGKAEMVFGKEGPMWYRGYFNNLLTQRELDNLLTKYGAKQVVVGHTVVSDICTLYDEKVYAIDVKHSMMVPNQRANALYVRGNKFMKTDQLGRKTPIGAYLSPDAIRVFKAISENNQHALADFLAKGYDINGYYSKDKYTLIHYTIKQDRVNLLNFLLKNGANPNLNYSNKTPLMYAIKYDNLEAVKRLLEQDVDVNMEDENQKTALYFAAKYGNEEIARLLIDKGARLNHKDQKGNSPIQYAIKNKNKAVADYLRSLQ